MLILFFLTSILSFHEIAQQPFEELEQFNQQQISIKGFVHKTANGAYILADEPNLKSCCKGSERLSTRQIWLEGDQAEKFEGQLVKVEGIFDVVETETTGHKMMLHRYSIVTSGAHISWQHGLMALGCVLLVLWLGFFRRYSQ